MKNLILGTGLLFIVAFTTSCASISAQETTKKTGGYRAQANEVELNNEEFNQAQLAQMLAPIALYPDSLLTHILIASTYPIEVVEAERWVSKKKNLSATQLSKKIEDKEWEPSIKALAMFPKVLERLSDDLSWTQQLGDAFLQNEESVLQAIQYLRYKAEQAGNLDKMDNVNITREDKNIIIQPVQKEVIYVPYYDTRRVYGNWHWSLNPPIYWDWGHHASYSHHRPFGWHNGIHISRNYFFSAFHWSNRHVAVVNHRNTSHYRPKKHIVRGGYANRWKHKPQHRRGVSYSNKQVNKRYSSHRPVVHKTVTKQYSGPKLHSSNKDYRVHKRVNNKIVSRKVNNKRSMSNANSRNHKVNKHEALQKKFNNHKTSSQRKGIFRNPSNKSVSKTVHKTTVKTNSNTSKHNKNVVRNVTNQSKTYGRNKEIVRRKSTVNNRAQRRSSKPVFKQTKVVKRQTTVKTRSKPQRTQRKEVRRRQSSSNNHRQQRNKRQERR